MEYFAHHGTLVTEHVATMKILKHCESFMHSISDQKSFWLQTVNITIRAKKMQHKFFQDCKTIASRNCRKQSYCTCVKSVTYIHVYHRMPRCLKTVTSLQVSGIPDTTSVFPSKLARLSAPKVLRFIPTIRTPICKSGIFPTRLCADSKADRERAFLTRDQETLTTYQRKLWGCTTCPTFLPQRALVAVFSFAS